MNMRTALRVMWGSSDYTSCEHSVGRVCVRQGCGHTWGPIIKRTRLPSKYCSPATHRDVCHTNYMYCNYFPIINTLYMKL